MFPEIINELLNVPYFTKLGEPVSEIADFKCEFVSSTKNVLKSISGLKWENVTNERFGDVSSFLCVNHRTLYNSMWNRIAETARNEISPTVVEKLERLPLDTDFIKVLTRDIKYNIVCMAIAAYFREYIHLEFHAKMLQIYKSGHIPCGWQGKWKNKDDKGYFLVH